MANRDIVVNSSTPAGDDREFEVSTSVNIIAPSAAEAALLFVGHLLDMAGDHELYLDLQEVGEDGNASPEKRSFRIFINGSSRALMHAEAMASPNLHDIEGQVAVKFLR